MDIISNKKLNDAGLNVACWNVNTEANYKLYGDMGVDMMTCDYLYPSQMPELTAIDWDAIEIPLDPLEIEHEEIFSHTAVKGDLPINFPDKSASVNSTAQQMAYLNGQFLVNNYSNSTLLALDQTGFVTTPYTGTATHGIAVDDAGNLILRDEAVGALPAKLKVYRAGSQTPISISFQLQNSGQTNFITASGDIFSSEGGYVYFMPNGHKYVNIVKIVNGVVSDILVSKQLSLSGTTASYVIPIENNPNKFIYLNRLNGFYLYDGEDKGEYLTGSSTTAPGRNTSVGGAYFKLGGHEIFIHPSGTHYNGGFSIRDMSAGKVALLTVEPYGTSGYSGNASCGAFMHVERINDDAVYLHQYCMAQGYASYLLKVKGTEIETSINTNTTRANFVYPNPTDGLLVINSSDEINVIDIYSLTGSLLTSFNGDGSTQQEINLADLASGVYFVKINHKNTIKVIKRR